MRNSLSLLIGAGAMAFAIPIGSVAVAQDDGAAPVAPTAPADTAMNPDQTAAYDSWPPDQQAAYDTWPMETRGYYWTLSPDRQDLFWRLSDEDRVLITSMSGPDRESTWQIIEARAAGAGAPASEPSDQPVEEPAPMPEGEN